MSAFIWYGQIRLEKFVTQTAFTYSKLTVETYEQGVKYVQKVNNKVVNFEHISLLVLVFLLVTL